MSLLVNVASVLKTIIMVDEEIKALKDSVKTTAGHVLDHEKRLIRIETMIELSRPTSSKTAPVLPKRKGLPKS